MKPSKVLLSSKVFNWSNKIFIQFNARNQKNNFSSEVPLICVCDNQEENGSKIQDSSQQSSSKEVNNDWSQYLGENTADWSLPLRRRINLQRQRPLSSSSSCTTPLNTARHQTKSFSDDHLLSPNTIIRRNSLLRKQDRALSSYSPSSTRTSSSSSPRLSSQTYTSQLSKVRIFIYTQKNFLSNDFTASCLQRVFWNKHIFEGFHGFFTSNDSSSSGTAGASSWEIQSSSWQTVPLLATLCSAFIRVIFTILSNTWHLSTSTTLDAGELLQHQTWPSAEQLCCSEW